MVGGGCACSLFSLDGMSFLVALSRIRRRTFRLFSHRAADLASLNFDFGISQFEAADNMRKLKWVGRVLGENERERGSGPSGVASSSPLDKPSDIGMPIQGAEETPPRRAFPEHHA